MTKRLLAICLTLALLCSAVVFPNTAVALNNAEIASAFTGDTLMGGRIYEAEDGQMVGGTFALLSPGRGQYSGTGFVDGFGDNSGVKFTVTVSQTGDYAIGIRYARGHNPDTNMSIYTNDNTAGAVQVALPKMYEWDNNAGTWGFAYINMHLKAGDNTVTVFKAPADIGGINLDCISVPENPVTVSRKNLLVNPGFEDGNTNGWTLWNNGNSGYGVDNGGPCTGSKKFYFHRGDAYQQRISQTVSGLESGVYMVCAFENLDNAAPNLARMELTGYDGDAATYSNFRDIGKAYLQHQSVIEIKDGQLTVSFYCDGNAGSSMQLDEVQLWKLNSTDKTALDTAVSTASAIEQGSYTEPSWSNFQTALTSAVNVLNNPAAAQTEINQALSALQTAQSALSGGAQQHTVTVSAGENGSITPATQVVAAGGTASFTVTPASGYEVDTVAVIPSVGYTLNGTALTIANVQSDLSVSITFKKTQGTLDWEAANAVMAKIDEIGTPITLSSESAIIAAESDYGTLSEAQKLLVTNYSDLTAARNEYNRISAPADYSGVTAAIANIPADLSLYTAGTAAAVTAAVTAVDYTLVVAQQGMVDGYAAAINNAVAGLIEKSLEMQVTISEGMVVEQSAGVYSITWNARILTGEGATVDGINGSAIQFKSYGVYYATGEEVLADYKNADASEIRQKIFEQGADIDVYTMFGFRLKNVNENAVRAVMFYIEYELNGQNYIVLSTIDETVAILAD